MVNVKIQKRVLIFVIALFQIFLAHSAFSQNNSATIFSEVTMKSERRKVLINYNLSSIKASDKYKISVFVSNTNQSFSINTNTFTGDVGNILIKEGDNKSIVWDVAKDGLKLNGQYSLNLSAERYRQLKRTKNLVLSTIYPGLGDYGIRKGKSYFVFGLAAYGAIATAIIQNQKASTAYNNYLNSNNTKTRDALFIDSKNFQNLSYIFAGIAGTIWIADLAGILSKTAKLKKHAISNDSKYYHKLNDNDAFKVTLGPKLLDTRSPYDFYIEKADVLFSHQQYEQAKAEYKEALSLSPDETLPKIKIAEIDNILNQIREKAELVQKEQKAKADLYRKTLANADSLLKIKEYEKAKIAYEYALELKPDDQYPQIKVKEITYELSNIQLDIDYRNNIYSADTAYISNNYDIAHEYYVNASELKSNEPYPKKQIELINNIIFERQQKLLSVDYVNFIVKADLALKKKKYEEAKGFYEEASMLKPDEQYPKSKINIINKIIYDETAINPVRSDLPSLFQNCKKAVFFVYTSDDYSISQGSGFFISASGMGVSNYHVFEGANRAKMVIKTEDGVVYKIETIIEQNSVLDFIIFKIDNKFNERFPFVKAANNLSDIGEKVFAIGNPEGYEKTLSEGIVSGYRGESKDYIQTTTPITHGSSGGPLFNMHGEVIGITTMGSSEGSLFFAVNISKLNLQKYIYK